MKTSVFGLLMLCFAGSLQGQATPTASKTFDLQVGGGFVIDHSDYGLKSYKGLGVYATLDFSPHFGAEIDFHQATDPLSPEYERTYEIGGRYHRNYGRFSPYAKALYGRGVFNFVYNGSVVANLAYNEFALGGGTDFAVLPWLNVRGDYEYQMWHSFPPNGLSPQLITIGVAYHFPGGLQKGRRFR
jgi:opacity protein-like surface antigen